MITMLTLVTVDAMSSRDRDKILNLCGLTMSKQCDVTTLLDFFCSLQKHGTHACPVELVKATSTEFDDFVASLIAVLTRKLGLDYTHVAIGCGGDPHDAFDADIALGQRVDECLEDAYARARILNNENLFRSTVKRTSFRDAPRVVWVRDIDDFEFKSRHMTLPEWISDL